MARTAGLKTWAQTVATNLPHLSKPQALVLAMWSYGMVLARSCGLTAVAGFLSALLKRKENTVRQQLREWCYDAGDKRGKPRAVSRLRLSCSACTKRSATLRLGSVAW